MEKKQKSPKAMKTVKIVYAFAVVLAVGTALMAKYATEKSLGNIKGSIEDDYISTEISGVTTKDTGKLTEDSAEDVRHNLTNVPDTREESETSTEKATTEKSACAVPYKDYYAMPLGTDIIKDYSGNTPVYSETLGDWRAHAGVDFKGEDGAQVKAISYGTVTDVYDDVILGTVITVDHGNSAAARYCGLNKDTIAVKKGDTVKEETLLGYLGTVPGEKEAGSHLHFEISYKGSTVDPLELMGK